MALLEMVRDAPRPRDDLRALHEHGDLAERVDAAERPRPPKRTASRRNGTPFSWRQMRAWSPDGDSFAS
jgi:hypothetical protein